MKHLPIYAGDDLPARKETRDLCADALLRGVTSQEVVTRVGLGVDAMHASLRERGFPGGPPPACAAGCSACCRGNRIEVTPPEVDLIARHLRSTREEAALRATAVRVANTARRATSMQAVRDGAVACAFLEDERCSIYEARPLACRHAHATDARACASRVETPPQNATLAANTAALVLGYREAFVHAGRPMAAYELHAAVEIVLGTPAETEASDALLRPAQTKSIETLELVLGAAHQGE